MSASRHARCRSAPTIGTHRPSLNVPVIQDAYEEQAAILEHDAGLPRAEAERRAAEMHLASGRPREA